jgi:signal transduction histidine kinase
VGERAEGRARTPGGEPDHRAELVDIARIAEAVRDLVGARAAAISRVVDESELEVVATIGTPSVDVPTGTRWTRARLDELLAEAEPHGRLYGTTRGAGSDLGLLITPIENADGELLGVLATEGDVDVAHPAPATCDLVEVYAGQARLALTYLYEHKLLAEQLRRDRALLEELRAVDQRRRDLVASITHDLKTPLTAIALNSELLESNGRSGARGEDPVAAIRRSTERLGSLVDDLLALARAEEGVAARPQDVDLVALVLQACQDSEPVANGRGIKFELDAPEELRVAVDADAVSRVFGNVVSNAVKFSLPEGEVRLRLRRTEDVVEFVCADDGIGIAHEDLGSVFDMFRRASDAQARGIPGSGFGMAISQRIVSRLGGTIEVHSEQGRGSTFTVRLPLGER